MNVVDALADLTDDQVHDLLRALAGVRDVNAEAGDVGWASWWGALAAEVAEAASERRRLSRRLAAALRFGTVSDPRGILMPEALDAAEALHLEHPRVTPGRDGTATRSDTPDPTPQTHCTSDRSAALAGPVTATRPGEADTRALRRRVATFIAWMRRRAHLHTWETP